MRSTALASIKEEETKNSYTLIRKTPKSALDSHPKEAYKNGAPTHLPELR
jgi:hypothetical protein